MIPEFDENGYLPPGLHPATLDEIEMRFGIDSEVRKAEMESHRRVVGLLWRAGAKRIVVNGSFVTDKFEPNDVDCVALIGGDSPEDIEAEVELKTIHSYVSLEVVDDDGFRYFTETTFASDRMSIAKGMIEMQQ